MNQSRENLLLILEADMYNPLIFYTTKKIAKAFNAPISVLLLWEENEEQEKKDELAFLQDYLDILSKKVNVKDVWVSNYKDQKHFESIIRNKHQENMFSHFVTLNHEEDWLSEFLYGSLSNNMVKDFPDAHLHLLSLKSMQAFEGEEYSPGKRAHLKSTENGEEIVIGKNAKYKEGLYFRKKSTDFETGLFFVLEQNQYVLYRVIEGVATLSETYPFKTEE